LAAAAAEQAIFVLAALVTLLVAGVAGLGMLTTKL
jgi:hypothetical protein